MSPITHHLAQANVARAIAPLDDPLMRGFVEQLDYINSVADNAPGFVWRLQSDEGDATGFTVFDDPLIVVNMSVWESVDALYQYVFRSDHLGPLRDRRRWFSKMDRPHSVLWWIRAGERPDLEDLTTRLELLRELGPTPQAFTFAHLFDTRGERLERPAHDARECGV